MDLSDPGESSSSNKDRRRSPLRRKGSSKSPRRRVRAEETELIRMEVEHLPASPRTPERISLDSGGSRWERNLSHDVLVQFIHFGNILHSRICKRNCCSWFWPVILVGVEVNMWPPGRKWGQVFMESESMNLWRKVVGRIYDRDQNLKTNRGRSYLFFCVNMLIYSDKMYHIRPDVFKTAYHRIVNTCSGCDCLVSIIILLAAPHLVKSFVVSKSSSSNLSFYCDGSFLFYTRAAAATHTHARMSMF